MSFAVPVFDAQCSLLYHREAIENHDRSQDAVMDNETSADNKDDDVRNDMVVDQKEVIDDDEEGL